MVQSESNMHVRTEKEHEELKRELQLLREKKSL